MKDKIGTWVIVVRVGISCDGITWLATWAIEDATWATADATAPINCWNPCKNGKLICLEDSSWNDETITLSDECETVGLLGFILGRAVGSILYSKFKGF